MGRVVASRCCVCRSWKYLYEPLSHLLSYTEIISFLSKFNQYVKKVRQVAKSVRKSSKSVHDETRFSFKYSSFFLLNECSSGHLIKCLPTATNIKSDGPTNFSPIVESEELHCNELTRAITINPERLKIAMHSLIIIDLCHVFHISVCRRRAGNYKVPKRRVSE